MVWTHKKSFAQSDFVFRSARPATAKTPANPWSWLALRRLSLLGRMRASRLSRPIDPAPTRVAKLSAVLRGKTSAWGRTDAFAARFRNGRFLRSRRVWPSTAFLPIPACVASLHRNLRPIAFAAGMAAVSATGPPGERRVSASEFIAPPSQGSEPPTNPGRFR